MHHARAVLEVTQAREQRLDSLLGVFRVYCRNLGVGPRGHHGEELGQVAAHVCVWAIEDVHARDLVRSLQNGLDHVGGGACDGGYQRVGPCLRVQRSVDVDDVYRVGHALCLFQVVVVSVALRCLGERASDILRSHAVHLCVSVPGVIQDCAHVLRHEVHAQHHHGGAASLHHLHRRVRHHQRVADEDVRVLRLGRHKHALHLRIHVKVCHDADVLRG
mmetsp:Transcript_2318/g.5544  ORF Transcript_2318/g.5544 Transcript_2318/m.5544 type:complete len:218 (+) Transcript_2318:1115-1768(+)